MPKRTSSGFTLLELSVVLVIIGLIVSGIFVGKALKREAQIRAMMGEYDEYLKAIGEFRDKYQALPGDFPGAQNIWGALSAAQCNGSAAITAQPTTNITYTCNGDGNGTIGASSTGALYNSNAALTTNNEWWSAWKHLSNAGLIEGLYTGAGYETATSTGSTLGYNVPSSALAPGGWTLVYYQNPATNTTMWGDNYGHVLLYGAAISNSYTYGAVLTPTEALSLDQKIDDGLPGTGKLRSWRTAFVANCINDNNSAALATYNTGYATAACPLMFLLGL